MAFCAEALERATDDVLEVFDRSLGGADRAAQRKRQEFERRSRRDTHATVRRFVDLSRLVLEAHDARTDVLRLIDRRIGLECLRDDLRPGRADRPPARPGHLALLLRRPARDEEGARRGVDIDEVWQTHGRRRTWADSRG